LKCDGVERILRAQNKSDKHHNISRSIHLNEEEKGLQLQVKSCIVKGVEAELMVNGSSLVTHMFMHESFNGKVHICQEVEIFQICVEYAYE
jgi:hypothetical protein